MILDCEVDINVPIIFGKPFLAIKRAVVDVERGDPRFRVNDEEVVFNICTTLNKAKDLQVISMIDHLWMT